MPSGVKLILVLSLMLLLAACDPIARKTSSSTAMLGMKAIIKADGREVASEITDVDGKYVSIDWSDWNGNHLHTAKMYRGLYPVGGVRPNGQYEYDFNESKLEALFPLEKGNETSFEGTFTHFEENSSYQFWVHMNVEGEKEISLPSGDRRVFVIHVTTQFNINGKKERQREKLYYDPEYNLILKKNYYQKYRQSHWRAISIILPGDVDQVAPQRRRSGTVLI